MIQPEEYSTYHEFFSKISNIEQEDISAENPDDNPDWQNCICNEAKPHSLHVLSVSSLILLVFISHARRKGIHYYCFFEQHNISAENPNWQTCICNEDEPHSSHVCPVSSLTSCIHQSCKKHYCFFWVALTTKQSHASCTCASVSSLTSRIHQSSHRVTSITAPISPHI